MVDQCGRLGVTVDAAGAHDISPDLWGAFFEDINHAADGGLNSDLVANGAFEYSRADSADWGSFTAWKREQPRSEQALESPRADVEDYAVFSISRTDSVAEENPHHAVVEVHGGPFAVSAALINTGYDGMPLHPGETYRFSMWAKAEGAESLPVGVCLERADADGKAIALAETEVRAQAGAWCKLTATLSVPENHSGAIIAGRLRLSFPSAGIIHLDFVTLEPETIHPGLPHMRADMVEALADLHPRFLRFPGGCIAHGKGLDNTYRWEKTIGPVEHRPHGFNKWGYHQSFRIGYFEYLCLCEAIGAKPVPVVSAGVSCQGTAGGPEAVALADMPDYIESVLGLIDFCNADPVDNPWAAKRAEMGHPEPFGLEYLGLGNEDRIDAAFRNRFRTICEAVRAAHPEIVVIGNAGPNPDDADFERGWTFARELELPVVDEHAYRAPSWWFQHLGRYDSYDRDGPQVYFGEYASRGSWLINALSEAAFMGAMERNGDVVRMASYAPLFSINGHCDWAPDLMYVDDEGVRRTYSYWVQQMFATTSCATAYPTRVDGPVTYRRELPDTVHIALGGGGVFDFGEIRVVHVADSGEVVVPATSYEGHDLDLGVNLAANDYDIHLRVDRWRSGRGFDLRFGDIHGKNWGFVSFGPQPFLRLQREGCMYSLAQTDLGERLFRRGATWEALVRVRDRGSRIELLIDGEKALEAEEQREEVRRTVNVARTEAGVFVVRVVNATPEPVEVDLNQVQDLVLHAGREVDMGAVPVTMLAADDQYAGDVGLDAPSEPTTADIDMNGGLFRAEPWSFSIIQY